MQSLTTEITPKDEFLQQTERILGLVKETGRFEEGFRFVDNLLAGRDVIDKSVSIILDGMEELWNPNEHGGEAFLDATIRMTRLTKVSVRRHTKIQGFLESDVIPDEFRDQIESGGQKSLIQVANVVDDGYELDHDDWLRISEKIQDERDTAKVIREITGRPPRSNFVSHWYDEYGVVWAWVNGRVVEAGRLNMDDDPDIVKQRDIWISRSKMTEKVNF